jgi:hypothetical protein
MPRLSRALVGGVLVLLLFAGPAKTHPSGCDAPSPGYAKLLLADDELRAYYRLDEPAGPAACDLAGDADGEYRGEYSPGQTGALTADGDPAVHLGGAGSVRIRSAAALNPTGSLSVEAWVQPDSIAPSETLLRKDGQYMLRLVGGSVVFRVWTSAGLFELASAPVMRTSYYQQLVGVLDGDRMRIFRNGNEIASRSVAGAPAATDSDLFLGSSFGDYDDYAGNLDEVAIYGRALSAGAVWDHYTAAQPRTGVSFLGCGFGAFGVAAWPNDCWRPYSAESPFNRRLPAQPRVAADSDRVVARLLSFGPIKHLEAGLADTPDDFGHPTYYSRPSDPVFRLHCYEESWGRCPLEGLEIRAPDAARPAGGDDAHLTVVDQDSGWEYDLYKVRSKPAGGGVLEIRWGGRTRIDGDGLGSDGTAAGFGSLAGLIRASELAAGHIDHALFVTVHCDDGRAVYPARKSGRSCATLGEPADDAPPMGAHLQLALSDEQIAALPGPEWKKTVLRAMADYGMFVGDTGGGSWGVQVESGSTFTSFGQPDPLVAFARANAWTPYGDLLVGNLRDGIDWAHDLRVIDPCVSRGTC